VEAENLAVRTELNRCQCVFKAKQIGTYASLRAEAKSTLLCLFSLAAFPNTDPERRSVIAAVKSMLASKRAR
jgi:hypothetical protein